MIFISSFFPTSLLNELVILKHVIKCFSEIISTFLDLQLLPVDFILNVINPLVQLGDVHLTVLKPALSGLVLLLDGEDFVFQLLFSLHSFLGRLFQRLHVLTNSLEFLLNSLQFVFGELSTVNGSFQFIFLDSKFPGEFIKLLFIVTCHLGGLPEVFVILLDGHFVVHACSLNNLDFLQNTVSILGGVGKLSDSISKILF